MSEIELCKQAIDKYINDWFMPLVDCNVWKDHKGDYYAKPLIGGGDTIPLLVGDCVNGSYLKKANDGSWLFFPKFYRIGSLLDKGYKWVRVIGSAGYSGLSCHVGCHNRVASWAMVSKNGNYAYVFFDDGSVVDGSFHQFNDGSFSLS